MTTLHRRLVFPVAAALHLVSVPMLAVQAQVSISPPVVVLSESERVSDFMVRNQSGITQEVTIDFRFGYMRSDSAGNLSMRYDDSTAASRHSMATWLRAFPRRFLLQPEGQQVVRLMARPPRSVRDGVYWTRLITASTPQSPPVDSATGGVRAQIIIRLEQVTTVLYRRGAVTTGVEAGALRAETDSSNVNLLLPLRRTGSAPFFGSVSLRVRDGRGASVHDARTPVAVYFDLLHRISVPRAALPVGSYSAEVRIENEGGDAAKDRLPPAALIALNAKFAVP
jgi:P pilus assembly chaperone PapD